MVLVARVTDCLSMFLQGPLLPPNPANVPNASWPEQRSWHDLINWANSMRHGRAHVKGQVDEDFTDLVGQMMGVGKEDADDEMSAEISSNTPSPEHSDEKSGQH